MIRDLAALSFVESKTNVALLGPRGVSKTHIAVGLAVAACRAGFTIYFTSLDEMVRQLKGADSIGRLPGRMRRYQRPDVLVVDEVGYLPLDRDEANLVPANLCQAAPKLHGFRHELLHDRTMLVELEKVAKFPWSPWLAQIRTPFGGTAVRWCGDQAAEPGEYHVEWTVDEDIVWGRNVKPAADSGPGVRPGGHCVVLRGRLNATEDGAAVLDLDGTLILLDLADPLPEDVANTWVELFIEREKISLYPYAL